MPTDDDGVAAGADDDAADAGDVIDDAGTGDNAGDAGAADGDAGVADDPDAGGDDSDAGAAPVDADDAGLIRDAGGGQSQLGQTGRANSIGAASQLSQTLNGLNGLEDIQERSIPGLAASLNALAGTIQELINLELDRNGPSAFSDSLDQLLVDVNNLAAAVGTGREAPNSALNSDEVANLQQELGSLQQFLAQIILAENTQANSSDPLVADLANRFASVDQAAAQIPNIL